MHLSSPAVRFVLRRCVVSALTLAAASVLIFIVLRLIPGDPSLALLGQAGVTEQEVRAVRHDLGLDAPIAAQLWTWISGAVTGDLGRSYFSEFPVTELIAPRAVATAELMLGGMVIAIGLAVPTALAAALHPGSRVDRVLCAVISVGLAVPMFIVGVVLLAVFAVQLGLAPTRGYVPFTEDPAENLQLLWLPALTLGLGIAAPIARMLRATLVEIELADFVRTARGKGFSNGQVLVRHILPNSLIPALNLVGLIVGTLMGGVVVIEYVFGWQGLGALALDAVMKRDYIVLQSVIVLAAACFVLSTLVVDVVSYMLDPRLRRQMG